MMTSLPTAVPQVEGLFDAVLRKPFTPDGLREFSQVDTPAILGVAATATVHHRSTPT